MTIDSSASVSGDSASGDETILPTESRGRLSPLPRGLLYHPGDMIGRYKLLEPIAEGGFGEVWLAESRGDLVQRVALKIIKAGMDTKAVIARFEQERQALAVMDHPNIAKVFDAGATLTGRPYFVMEHVPGEAITAYADRQNLSVRERLELFIPVCEAIQHAHHKGIIHRDIKPSNILVAVRDGGPIPKVIDFGVAKAVSHTLTDKTIFTETGQLIGTPEYMSPEQAEMGAIDIDTRTDVYSLGVVLYELLSGLLPFDSQSLRAAGYEAIRKVLREQDAPKPSTRLSAVDNVTGAAIARHRVIQREHLATQLRRELDWIPLKALRKDRTARYDTPTDLARDVQRYLDGQPLDAGPEAAGYRIRKFLLRHKGAVMAAAFIAVTLVLGAAGIAWQARIANDQRKSADVAKRSEEYQRRRLSASEALLGEKSGIPDAVSHYQTKRHEAAGLQIVLVEQVNILRNLQAAAENLDIASQTRQKQIEAEARDTIRRTLREMAHYNLPDVTPTEAFNDRLTIYRQTSKLAGEADLNDMSLLLLKQNRLTEAESTLRKGVEVRRAALPDGQGQFAMALSKLALALQYQNKFAEAEALYREAIQISRAAPDRDGQLALGMALNNLGNVLSRPDQPDQSQLVEAEALYRETIQIERADMPEGDRVGTGSLANLAMVLKQQHKFAEAEALYREVLQSSRADKSASGQRIVRNLNNLADVLMEQSKLVEAERLFRDALALSSSLLRVEDPDVATRLSKLAALLRNQNKPEEAREVFDVALEILRIASPAGSPFRARVLWLSGTAKFDCNDADAALPELEDAVAMANECMDPDDPHLKEYRETLAKCKAAMQTPIAPK